MIAQDGEEEPRRKVSHKKTHSPIHLSSVETLGGARTLAPNSAPNSGKNKVMNGKPCGKNGNVGVTRDAASCRYDNSLGLLTKKFVVRECWFLVFDNGQDVLKGEEEGVLDLNAAVVVMGLVKYLFGRQRNWECRRGESMISPTSWKELDSSRKNRRITFVGSTPFKSLL